MSTTLPLFWHLSSASQQERINASIKLITTLEQFQSQFVPKAVKQAVTGESSEEDEEDREEDQDEVETSMEGVGKEKMYKLDDANAEDVSYSIRRLVRGLASPVESSRIGFAVALTEVHLIAACYIEVLSCNPISSFRG
jgi:DNA polymerase phi